jgi:hypothetical protein
MRFPGPLEFGHSVLPAHSLLVAQGPFLHVPGVAPTHRGSTLWALTHRYR